MSRSEKDDEQMERRQRKSDAGLLSERYPDISSIVVSMDYYQRNTGLAFIKRTVPQQCRLLSHGVRQTRLP